MEDAMLTDDVWGISRPEYRPYLEAARTARAAVIADAWRALRRGVARRRRRRPRTAAATAR
jgi:hypothetical protein